jgi:type IV pilus assembly protein PilW
MKRENGFTLLELLVVMTLSGIVMAAIYATFLSQQRSYRMTEQVVAVQQNLRGAMYFMERELRIAGYDPKRTNDFGVTDIPAIAAQSITFTMDTTTENGVVGITDGETITYQYNAGANTLTRDAGAGPQVIAENITGLTFTGMTGTGVATTVAANVRWVDVTITGTLGGHTRTLNTRVRCRNMGL